MVGRERALLSFCLEVVEFAQGFWIHNYIIKSAMPRARDKTRKDVEAVT